MDKVDDFKINSPRWLSLEDFEGEIWKDLPDFEGTYQVSNLGLVKTKNREKSWIDKRGVFSNHSYKSHILKAVDNGHGYLAVLISERKIYIHRLVGVCFVPNPQNKPEIDHIDANRQNNKATNLRWVTKIENRRNIITYARQKVCHSIPIVALDYFGNYVCEFYGAQEAADRLNIARTVVKDIVSKKRYAKLACGLQFIRKSEYDEKKDYSILLKKSRKNKELFPTLRMVVMLDVNDNIIDVYPNSVVAACCLGKGSTGIANRCRKKFFIEDTKWFYLKDLPENLKEEAIKSFINKYHHK